MREVTGVNGADIKIGVASFKDAMSLKNSIMKIISNNGLKLDNIDFKKIDLKTDLDLDIIIKPLTSIDSDESFNNALIACMSRCLYDGEKITPNLFEQNVQAREDYYLIMIEVLKENLIPFFKGLVSSFKNISSVISKK